MMECALLISLLLNIALTGAVVVLAFDLKYYKRQLSYYRKGHK